jgi:type II secretory pathway pseudopilin PulG
MHIHANRKVCKGQFCIKPTARMRGFTFIGLLVIVAIMGVALLAVGEVWSFAQKREKEHALLYVGGQFRQAIKLYYMHTPAAGKLQPYPMSLEDLLKDPRSPSTQRYLRKIYLDPLSNSPEWGLLKYPNGGIYGVYSLSIETPIKRNNFRLVDKSFEGKTKYADWIFLYVPIINPNNPVAAH